jgi:hypothetical protein
MKTHLVTVLAVGLLFGGGAARAEEQADATALVTKAMKAMNGEAKLAKLSTASVKGKVSGSEGGQDITVTLNGTWRGMSHYRVELDALIGGQTFSGVLVINGDKGWFKDPNRTEDAPEGAAAFVQNLFYAMRMPQLLPALSHKDYKLAPLGEVQIGTHTGVGVSVSHKERKDVHLFFDKKTGLPLKSEIRLEVPKENKEITVEYHYSDYKEFDGVKLCGKIAIKADGKEFTLELGEIRPIEKVDDGQFERP